MRMTGVAMAIAVGVAAGVPGAAAEADWKGAAKKIMADHAESLVWVKYTTKGGEGGLMAMMGGGGQNASTALGTVLSEDGVVVFAQPPLAGIMAMMGGGQDAEEPTPEDIKVVLAGGKELEADFLAQEKDYALMFVKIRKESLEKEKAVLKAFRPAQGVKVEVGDGVLALGRKAERLGSAVSLQHGTIDSEVVKPIKAYSVTNLMSQGMDLSPVFDAQGGYVGFLTLYTGGKRGGGGPSLDFRDFERLIIPEMSLRGIFDQAKQAKPHVKKAAGKKETPDDDE